MSNIFLLLFSILGLLRLGALTLAANFATVRALRQMKVNSHLFGHFFL